LEEYRKKLKNQLTELTQIIYEGKESLDKIQVTISNFKDLPKGAEELLNIYVTSINQEINENTNQENKFSKDEINKWIKGVWLESYVLGEIKKIEKDFNIEESGMNFYIKDPKYRSTDKLNPEERARFEFDVAFIKGYQLFAISCTTKMEHKEHKHKLFEAHLRARQLGGDEARTALVCCSKNPGDIEDEIRFAVRDKKIRVFGIKHLKNLADNIKEWIKETENDQEEN